MNPSRNYAKLRKKFPVLARAGLIILWIVLFALVLERDYFVREMELREAEFLRESREESYQGIFFGNDRIGYVRSRLVPATGTDLQLEQESFLRLNILGQTHPVSMTLSALLAGNSVLKNFSFSFSSPLYKMAASGEVQGDILAFRLDTGKSETRDRLRLTSAPFLPTLQRGFLLRENPEIGRKVKIPFFDPFSLSSHDRVVEYRGLEKILIQGRVRLLHHFIETFAGIRINSWLDEQGKVIKEESPAGFVLIAEPEFRARDIVRPAGEMLSAVAVQIKGEMPGPEGLREQAFRVTIPEEAEINLHGDRQTGNGDLVRIILENLPAGDAVPCTGQEQWLAASPYIQTGAPEIAALAGELTAGSSGALEKIRRLADWVYRNIDKRPVIGIPDALTTLRQKIGDCNEHAALFSALARSLGIPARIAAGVTYHNKAFYYHAWNEVCLNNTWLSLDTTKNQVPADVSHIKFVEGETMEMLKIAGLLGRLGIEVLPAGDNHEGR